jgi:preprotein translocase subunit SecG
MLLIVFHVIVCALLVGVVLLQQGRSDMGASLGGGGNTFFGAAGADNLLVKVTTGLAIIFMVSSIFLARSANAVREGSGSLLTTEEVPVAPPSEPGSADSGSPQALPPAPPSMPAEAPPAAQ